MFKHLAVLACIASTQAAIGAQNVLDGFFMFAGPCMGRSGQNLSPILVPFATKLLSGGLSAAGTAISNAGAARDTVWLAPANFRGWEDDKQCLHLVSGRVYTSPGAFLNDKVPLQSRLPLPWQAAALELAGNNQQKADAELKGLLERASEALAASGAMLADVPNFFAEVAIVRPSGSSPGQATFRLRSVYYGKAIESSFLRSDNSYNISFTVIPMPSDGKLPTAIPPDKAINAGHLKNGTSAFFPDFFIADEPTPLGQPYESPYQSIETGGDGKGFVLIGVLSEHRPQNQVLTVLGTAMSESAQATAEAAAKQFDPAQVAAAKKAAFEAQNKQLDDMQTSATGAVDAWAKAKADYDACAANPSAATFAAYTKSKIALTIALQKAAPLLPTLGLNTLDLSFLEGSQCVLP